MLIEQGSCFSDSYEAEQDGDEYANLELSNDSPLFHE